MPRGKLVAGEGVVIEGLVPLQRALRRSEGNLGKNLRKRLREAAEPVKSAAKGNVRSRSGTLEGSIRIGVNLSSVSVYSNVVYANVQDQGGRVGRNHATLLKRAEVSQYMTRGIQQAQGAVNQRVGRVLDDLANDFES